MLSYSAMEKLRPWLVIFSVLIFVGLGGWLASFFLRGYKLNLHHGLVMEPTGLLVVNSDPKGASVFLNNKLVTATDDTLNLSPGRYVIRIVKDGYLPWQKAVVVKKEIVKRVDAYLFRSAPDLRPLTLAGALSPQLSPNGDKVAYVVASASAENKNGIWISSLSSSSILPLGNSPRQIVVGNKHHWEKANLVWSPDSRSLLVIFHQPDGKITAAYLFATDTKVEDRDLKDVSFQLPRLLRQWHLEKERKLTRQLETLPKPLYQVATASAQWAVFSPDGEKICYLAIRPAKLPANLVPHPPARSDQPETRAIKPGHVYVYNLEEDTNFDLGTADNLGINLNKNEKKKTNLREKLLALNQHPIYWLSTSNHLVFVHQHKIWAVEADGTNRTVLFAGPFADKFIAPLPNGQGVVVLTALYANRPANLYVVKVK